MVDLSSYQPVTDLFDHRERPERRPKLELRPRRDRRRPMVADKRREKPRQEVKKPSRTKKKANTSRFK